MRNLQESDVKKDLEWILNSSPIWNSKFSYDFEKKMNWGERLVDLALIQNTKRVYKLGIYYEALIFILLRDLYGVKNLHWNIPVRGQKSYDTLGEFDFLFSEPGRNQTTHLEVALKFYCYVPEQKEWVGPTGKDTWSRKKKTLLEKQLVLSKTSEGIEVIKQHGLSENVQSHAWVQGVLFHPWGEDQEIQSNLNLESVSGVWIRESDFFKEKFLSQKKYKVLERVQWMSGGVKNDFLTSTELKDRVSKRMTEDSCVQLMESENHHRIMIVSDEYRGLKEVS